MASAGSLVDEAAHALIARQEPVTWIDGQRTGSAWKSAAQSPDYRTDRALGAAGIGMAFLAAYDVTGNAAYLNSASAAGDFLLAAQLPADSGRWPSYYNPAGAADNDFTSFDEGAPGIADFLWRLYERTGNAVYASTALAAMDWEISEAETPEGQTCPSVCFWRWQDPARDRVYTGLGHGVAGIVWALDGFAARRAGVDPARSARYAAYARAGAAWLESQMVYVKLPGGKSVAKIPEIAGTAVFATGLQSGSAGDALLFYRLYASTGRAQYRRDADLLLAGLRADAVTDGTCAGVTWPLDNAPGRSIHSAGVGPGNAGIGWVALQAYKLLITREPALAIKDLELARAAGDWLLSPCAVHDQDEKAYWPEDSRHREIDTSLDKGAAGIGIFLYDLYGATGSPSYSEGAADSLRWIASVPVRGHAGLSWCEGLRSSVWRGCGETSWDLGAAGILDMAARFEGWPLDIPADVPGFDGPH